MILGIGQTQDSLKEAINNLTPPAHVSTILS